MKRHEYRVDRGLLIGVGEELLRRGLPFELLATVARQRVHLLFRRARLAVQITDAPKTDDDRFADLMLQGHGYRLLRLAPCLAIPYPSTMVGVIQGALTPQGQRRQRHTKHGDHGYRMRGQQSKHIRSIMGRE